MTEPTHSHASPHGADASGGAHHVGAPSSNDLAQGGHHEPHSLAKYIYVFFALCVLTGASFFTYSRYWPFHETPQVGWAFMMAVSCTKAMLVILFFMHVKYEANWKYVLTIPPAIMAIFLMAALVPDVGRRLRMASEERLKFMATPRTAPADPPAASHH